MQAFNQAILTTRKYLAAGDISGARTALDKAWELAGNVKARRKLAHDVANVIQRAICEMYLSAH